MTSSQFEQRVKRSLDKSVTAYNQGQPEFFDELADDAMIVLPDSPQTINGREAYRQRFTSAWMAQPGEKTVLSRNVQIVDSKAVVTQTARVSHGQNTTDVLQTIVFAEAGEGVKVLHAHTARMTPQSAGQHVAPEGFVRPPVQVVNERIATIASVSGVAQ